MELLAVGTALSASSRARFLGWLRATRTGNDHLRAGLPATWSSGDKTGTGDHGATNDIAVTWPPRRAPIVIAAYCTDSNRSRARAMP